MKFNLLPLAVAVFISTFGIGSGQTSPAIELCAGKRREMSERINNRISQIVKLSDSQKSLCPPAARPANRVSTRQSISGNCSTTRAYLAGLRENLAARKAWLEKNAPAAN